MSVSTHEFQVGNKFADFESLQAKVAEFEKKAFVQFYKRDTRTVEAARKRRKGIIDEKLK